MWGGVFAVENFCVDPFNLYLHAVVHPTVRQRFFEGFIRILQLDVFADNGDFHFALGVVDTVIDVVPTGQIGFRRGRDLEGVQYGLIQTLFMVGQRCLVDGFQVIGRDNAFLAHVAKQRDFFAFLLRDWMLGPAYKHIGRDADGLQFLDGVLGRLCL